MEQFFGWHRRTQNENIIYNWTLIGYLLVILSPSTCIYIDNFLSPSTCFVIDNFLSPSTCIYIYNFLSPSTCIYIDYFLSLWGRGDLFLYLVLSFFFFVLICKFVFGLVIECFWWAFFHVKQKEFTGMTRLKKPVKV